MINIAKNKEALSLFLQIINAHGAFIKEREIIKRTKSQLPTREEKENLISTEKYYKKLKHQFSERFPSLKDEMKSQLSIYLSDVENKKRQHYALVNSITNLSKRFISFYQYNFLGTQGVNIAYSTFSNNIKNKCDQKLVKNVEERFDNMLNYDFYGEKSRTIKLDLNSIHLLASFLKEFIDNISKEDLENIDKHISNNENIEEKRKTVYKIINENYNRFKKLYLEYSTLNEDLKNL